MILVLLLSVLVLTCNGSSNGECSEIDSPACATSPTVDHKLGPEYDSEHCTADGCDIPGSVRPGSGNLQPPSPESKTSDELSEKKDGGVLGWNVFSTIGNVISSVKDTVQRTVIKKASEIYENVRSAVRDEMFDLLETLWENMVTPMSNPGESFKHCMAIFLNDVVILHPPR